MTSSTSADTRRRIQRHLANLQSPDQKVAAEAENRLIRFGEKAVEPLLATVDHEDPQVRFRAVWALGKIGDARALPAILRLTEDPDERVAYDAVLALGELGDPRAMPRLREIAAGPADERTLDSAARTALVKLGQPDDRDKPH
jgi:HEAT repeat protein